MPWVAVDDQFPEHDKVADLSDRAFRIHITALCYCARNLTDGFLDARQVKIVCAIVQVTRAGRYIDELVQADLWIVADDGNYSIKHYLEYNPSKDQVGENRAKARDRMKRLRSGGTSGEGSGERAGEGSGTPSPPLPSPAVLALLESPTQDAARARNSVPANERLLAAAGGGHEASAKLTRTIRRWKSPEGDLEYAIECATGPGVSDPLAVALATLKRRGEERAA